MAAKDALGRRGEELAARHLASAGLRILDRNWRCAYGELDIVAAELRRGRRIFVVCEVKTRGGLAFGHPVEAVDRRKLARLRRLAALWLAAHGTVFDEIRIDVIGVLRDSSGGFSLDHVRGVG